MLEIVLLFVSLLVCLQIKYRRGMVDLVQRFHDVYNKWESRPDATMEIRSPSQGEQPLKRRASSPTLVAGVRPAYARRVSHDRRKLSVGSRCSPATTQLRADVLAQFKTMPTLVPDNGAVRPPMESSVCTKCFPSMTSPPVELQLLGIQNLLKVPSANRANGFLTRQCHDLIHCWKKTAKFYYPSLSKTVLTCDQVMKAIECAATRDLEDLGLEPEHHQRLLRKHTARAAALLKLMKANISSVLIRITAWVLFKCLGRMLTSIQVHRGQLELIKKFGKSDVPLVYLPLHRSHLDYILITFILFNEEVKAPLVAAGDNLRMPLFSPIMRGLGAYFIKRKLDPKDGKRDYVYRAVLNSYMVANLSAGHSMEFFIEGGRSRSGKAYLPKAGLLSVVVDTHLRGLIDDAYVVPVGISYEKLLDGNFISEQMGKTKVNESVLSTVRGIWNVCRGNYGSVRVDFAHPFSLRDFVQACPTFEPSRPRFLLGVEPVVRGGLLRSVSSTASLYGTDVIIEDQRFVVKTLAEHVLYDAVQVTALMSTNLVAFLLLNKYRQGVLFRSLVRDFDWLREEVKWRRRDMGFTGESASVVRHALNLLGPATLTEEESVTETHLTFIRPVTTLPRVLDLAYYSNVVLSVFVKDSILACSLSALLGDDLDAMRDLQSAVTLSRQQLMEKALDLCDILQYEFILTRPCTTIEATIDAAIRDFVHREILTTMEPEGRKLRFLEWEDDEDYDDDVFAANEQRVMVNLSSDVLEKLRLFRNLVAPILEGYWQLAACLPSLIGTEMEEDVFVRAAQASAVDRIAQNLAEYGESVAADVFRNGLRLFTHWKVLDSYVHDSVKLVFLTDAYNNEERVGAVLEVFDEFRK